MITCSGGCGGSLCPLLAGGRHYRGGFNEAVTLLMNNELQILPVRIAASLCSVTPCLQPLTIFQRSLTTMQIQIQGLLQFAVPLFPTAEVSHKQETSSGREWLGFSDERLCLQRDLLGVQHLLNSSEASLHQLTALLDCRGLNKVCFFCVCLVSEQQNWVSRREVKLGGEKATVPD